MIRVGVIHIGSSKIRLILAEVEEMGYFKVIDELKTPFKICYELSKECILCSEKLNYILSTIKIAIFNFKIYFKKNQIV